MLNISLNKFHHFKYILHLFTQMKLLSNQILTYIYTIRILLIFINSLRDTAQYRRRQWILGRKLLTRTFEATTLLVSETHSFLFSFQIFLPTTTTQRGFDQTVGLDVVGR